VVEGAAAARLDGETLAGLDIGYFAETLYLDSVVVRTKRDPSGSGRMDHVIVHGRHGVEAVRARTRWFLR